MSIALFVDCPVPPELFYVPNQGLYTFNSGAAAVSPSAASGPLAGSSAHQWICLAPTAELSHTLVLLLFLNGSFKTKIRFLKHLQSGHD